MKTLILVDFDKTLYKKDSLIEFTKFYKGNFKFYIGIFFLSPFFILMKLGIISNQKTKESFLIYFFKNENYDDFKQKGDLFAKTKIQKNINLSLLNKLKLLNSKENIIYLVTASCSEWISKWSTQYQIKIISTNLEVINNKITGKIVNKNCNGVEKVKRIKKEINLNHFDKIVVFGNGKGDYEMQQLEK